MLSPYPWKRPGRIPLPCGERSLIMRFDAVLDFEEVPTLFQFIELEQQLSELPGVSVHLVMRSALKPGIGPRILAEAVTV